MKQETFEKAQELQTKIQDYDQAIEKVEKNQKNCNGFPINIDFCYDDDKEALKEMTLNWLKNKRKIFQKQFDNLK